MGDLSRTCIKCFMNRPIVDYSKDGYSGGFRNTCKKCQAKYRKEHYKKNKEKENKQASKYKKENRGKVNAINSARYTGKLNRTLDKEKHKRLIEVIYKKCSEYRAMGFDFEVDHVIPLKGKGVSGLHVPWNLQIVTKEYNLKKRDKYECN